MGCSRTLDGCRGSDILCQGTACGKRSPTKSLITCLSMSKFILLYYISCFNIFYYILFYFIIIYQFWLQTVPVTSGTYGDPEQHGPSLPAQMDEPSVPPHLFWSKWLNGVHEDASTKQPACIATHYLTEQGQSCKGANFLSYTSSSKSTEFKVNLCGDAAADKRYLQHEEASLQWRKRTVPQMQ